MLLYKRISHRPAPVSFTALDGKFLTPSPATTWDVNFYGATSQRIGKQCRFVTEDTVRKVDPPDGLNLG